ADGGQQAPVNAVAGSGFLKGLFVAGQAIVNVMDKGARPDVVDLLHMAVVTLLELDQGAVLLDAVKELLGQLQQGVIPGFGKDPVNGARLGNIECLPYPREVGLMDGQLVGVDDGDVDFSFL